MDSRKVLRIIRTMMALLACVALYRHIKYVIIGWHGKDYLENVADYQRFRGGMKHIDVAFPLWEGLNWRIQFSPLPPASCMKKVKLWGYCKTGTLTRDWTMNRTMD